MRKNCGVTEAPSARMPTFLTPHFFFSWIRVVGALNYSEERFPKDATDLPNDIVLPDIADVFQV